MTGGAVFSAMISIFTSSSKVEIDRCQSGMTGLSLVFVDNALNPSGIHQVCKEVVEHIRQ